MDTSIAADADTIVVAIAIVVSDRDGVGLATVQRVLRLLSLPQTQQPASQNIILHTI